MRTNGLTRWMWAAALALVAMCAAPVGAFYWYGWPGGPPPERTVTPPDQHKDRNPPDRPPVNPPPHIPPGGPPGTPNSPTPEPTTALAALAGLSVLAAARALRRKKPTNAL